MDFKLASFALPLEAAGMEIELIGSRVAISIRVPSFEVDKLVVVPYQEQGVKFGW